MGHNLNHYAFFCCLIVTFKLHLMFNYNDAINEQNS